MQSALNWEDHFVRPCRLDNAVVVNLHVFPSYKRQAAGLKPFILGIHLVSHHASPKSKQWVDLFGYDDRYIPYSSVYQSGMLIEEGRAGELNKLAVE